MIPLLSVFENCVKRLASLRLTIALLTCLFFLVFFGTLAQVEYGIYWVQKIYFQSWFLWVEVFGISLPYFPSGMTVGWGLMINLLSAAYTRKLWLPNKVGLCLVHIGLIFLIFGAALTTMLGTESQLKFKEGEKASYTQAFREVELVVIDGSNPNYDEVTAFPYNLLKDGAKLSHDSLPFSIKIDHYYDNVTIFKSPSHELSEYSGLAPQFTFQPSPVESDHNKVDFPTAFIQINDQKYVLSRGLQSEQEFNYDGRDYYLAIRPIRYYLGYELQLNDFTHERYEGTSVPRFFSSNVTVFDEDASETQRYLIYMNHPLRYKGKVFYQASFADGDTVSILQVVENPSWVLPYIASFIIGLGLIVHFGVQFNRFRSRRAAK
jgi:hypothetical protein